jgi:hypothetical protein
MDLHYASHTFEPTISPLRCKGSIAPLQRGCNHIGSYSLQQQGRICCAKCEGKGSDGVRARYREWYPLRVINGEGGLSYSSSILLPSPACIHSQTATFFPALPRLYSSPITPPPPCHRRTSSLPRIGPRGSTRLPSNSSRRRWTALSPSRRITW